jgi:cell division protein FtsZ
MNPADVLVVGIGGGGVRVTDLLAADISGGAAFAAVDTDTKALAESSVPAQVEAGLSIAKGLGTGGDTILGRRALTTDIEKIRTLMSGKRLVVILTCLGGGTGSSGAVLVKAARDAGAVTLCFATQPFEFEGASRRKVAKEAASRLEDVADVLVLVANDQLTGTAGGASVADAFGRANEVLTSGVAATWQLVTRPGYINLGLADIQQAVGRSGVCGFAYAQAEGQDKASRAVERLFAGPLLDGGSALERAQSLLVSIVGGADLTLQDVSAVMDKIAARAPAEAGTAMGTVIDETWQDRLGVLLLVSEGRRPPAHSEPQTASAAPAGDTGRRGRKRRKATHTQTKLSFDSQASARFRNAQPTILNGEDLDTPTFIRRGIRIEK